MSHEVETMAWANEVPWHGLGNRVDSAITVDEMVKAAGLDWDVTLEPTYTKIGSEYVELPRKALVRSTDKRILTVVGNNWKPLQNKDALGFFREYTEAGGATLETAGSLRGGKIIWGLASVKKGFTIMNGRDKVKGYILLISPHDVGKGITVRATSVRVVCANTLALAENEESQYRQSHVREFNVAAAKEMVAFTKDQIGQMELEARALQSLEMSEFDTVRVLAKYFQPAAKGAGPKEERKHVEALVNTPETRSKQLNALLLAVNKAPGATPGSAWGVLNGVTYWSDHMAGRNADARLFRSWLGENASKKKQIKDELLAMANG